MKRKKFDDDEPPDQTAAVLLVLYKQSSVAGHVDAVSYMYRRGGNDFSTRRLPAKTGLESESPIDIAEKAIVTKLLARQEESQITGLAFLENEPICRWLVRGDRGGPAHAQKVMLAKYEHAAFRDNIAVIQQFKSEDEILDPPEEMEAVELWTAMQKSGLHSHLVALSVGLSYLTLKNAAYAMRYGRIVDGARPLLDEIQKLNAEGCENPFAFEDTMKKFKKSLRMILHHR